MSSFGGRRKARVIKVDDDEPTGSAQSAPGATDGLSNGMSHLRMRRAMLIPMAKANSPSTDASAVKFTKKPFRQSGLRKSVNFNEEDDGDGPTTTPAARPPVADDEDEGPVVVRPNIGRAGSKQKKRGSSSRLSFGPRPATDDDDESVLATPRKPTLGAQAIENSALKKATPTQRLPLRRFNDDEDDRPRYSKEYLAELQSSTPNTPQDLSRTKDHDEMELDESELEGAMIVNDGEYSAAQAEPPAQTNILSATQIAERKQRRARLAHEQQDFISLDGDDHGGARKTEPDSRLVPEDEDLGEGFDDFVEDGGLSLGNKAEREAKARRRREMAEQIQIAEGNSDDESEDSDAERRVAFEAAQSRSGMDGLSRPEVRAQDAALQVPAKITPLPELEGCLQRLRATLSGMETTLQGKQNRIDALKTEREAIVAREVEVQGLLDEAGKKYTAAMGGGANAVPALEPGQSPARQIQNAGMSELAVSRGLESFGTTPNQRPDVGENE